MFPSLQADAGQSVPAPAPAACLEINLCPFPQKDIGLAFWNACPHAHFGGAPGPPPPPTAAAANSSEPGTRFTNNTTSTHQWGRRFPSSISGQSPVPCLNLGSLPQTHLLLCFCQVHNPHPHRGLRVFWLTSTLYLVVVVFFSRLLIRRALSSIRFQLVSSSSSSSPPSPFAAIPAVTALTCLVLSGPVSVVLRPKQRRRNSP